MLTVAVGASLIYDCTSDETVVAAAVDMPRRLLRAAEVVAAVATWRRTAVDRIMVANKNREIFVSESERSRVKTEGGQRKGGVLDGCRFRTHTNTFLQFLLTKSQDEIVLGVNKNSETAQDCLALQHGNNKASSD